MSIGFDPGPARKLSWRLLHSLWMLLPVLGFGCLGAAALIFIGARMSRPAVWISGIGYLAISTALFFAIGATDAETAVSNWLVGAWLLTWLVTMLHALAINPSWLRWKAGHVPWHAAPAMPLAPPPGYPAAPPAPAAPLDVNSATAAQLATLPAMDHARALRAVSARERLGGFPDVWAFGNALELQPHEYVLVHPHVVANPIAGTRPVPPPQSTPPPEPSGHAGRIVDV